MAVGDIAAAFGYPLVPQNGEAGKVKHGAEEINRTRDFVAEIATIVYSRVGADPGTSRFMAGIFEGTGVPNNASGLDGDIYYKTDSPYNVYIKVTGAWRLTT